MGNEWAVQGTGRDNIGNRNVGSENVGSYNVGHRNTGNYNTGDWNKASHVTGCFNTKSQPFYLFDKPCDWSYEQWNNSDARMILDRMPQPSGCGPALTAQS